MSPVFVNQSEVSNTNTGKPFDLYFTFISKPQATYQLYFENNELSSSNISYSITAQSEILSELKQVTFLKISIGSVLPDHNGSFTCKAKNIIGERFSRIFLNVSCESYLFKSYY